MAAQSAMPTYVNGDRHSVATKQQYVDFYDKLFALQDAVLAGQHPRIRLPESALKNVASRVANLTNTSSTVANNVLNGAPSSKASAPAQQPPNFLFSQAQSLAAPTPTFGRSASANSSSIDPVLLEKPDHLIRAESQLKRQRIERALKEQYENRRKDARDKDAVAEAEITLDVSDLVEKAQKKVVPISGIKNTPASDSFDENSYYSSKGSWSTHAASQRADANTDAAPVAVDPESGVNGDIDTSEGSADMLVDQQQDIDPDDVDYEPALDLGMDESVAPIILQESDQGEDDDYSPPPVDAHSVQVPSFAPPPLQLPELSVPKRTQHYTPEAAPVRRNHIEQPVAPQPVRVSPLATARGPRPNRGRNNKQARKDRSRQNSPIQETVRNGDQYGSGGRNNVPSPRNSGRQSPNGQRNGGPNSRKRQREVEANERQQRRLSGKRVARSPPTPIIKEEPVSPPPFSFSDPQPLRRRGNQIADDIEVLSPREARSRPAYHRERDARPSQYYDEPTSPTFLQPPPRAAPRRLERDDQDLRRVASLQYARRPHSPPTAGPYGELRNVRAASHAYVEQVPMPAAYRSGSMRPPSSQFARDRSRSPPYVDDGYVRTRTPVAMGPPPPKPFIVDEFGNKYYAAPVPVERSRQVYDRASTREPTARPSARVADIYDEDDGMTRMAPPPRRYIDQGDVEVTGQRPLRVREYSVAPNSRREHETGERRPIVVYEDMPPPQQYVTRAYSVRPDAGPREAPVDYVTRHQSQAPAREFVRRAETVAQPYREMSVYDSEGPPRYASRAAVPQRRYVEDLEEEVYEPRRASYRYA